MEFLYFVFMSNKIYSIQAGDFKLDGGAMFGVVPKSIWSRTNPADENNMCSWSTRCMLVENGNRLILIDTGLGNKQSEKFFNYYYLHGDFSLKSSLKKAGFSPSDVTEVFLTHLHFDHCGGAIEYNENGVKVPAFPNAKYWSNKNHWQWAINPNAREKASFLSENILPIQESGQLNFVEAEGELFPGFEVLFVNGHTEAMMLPLIEYKGTKFLYMADLVPSVGHLPLPYIMGYDVRPLQTLEEKTKLLNKAVSEKWNLFFEHDNKNECCSLVSSERGIRAAEIFSINSF